MKFRYKDKPEITGFSDEFNMHGLGEIILFFDEGDATSESIGELQVLIEKPIVPDIHPGTWISFREAITARFVITDNYDKYFREPLTIRERDRGWY